MWNRIKKNKYTQLTCTAHPFYLIKKDPRRAYAHGCISEATLQAKYKYRPKPKEKSTTNTASRQRLPVRAARQGSAKSSKRSPGKLSAACTSACQFSLEILQ